MFIVWKLKQQKTKDGLRLLVEIRDYKYEVLFKIGEEKKSKSNERKATLTKPRCWDTLYPFIVPQP